MKLSHPAACGGGQPLGRLSYRLWNLFCMAFVVLCGLLIAAPVTAQPASFWLTNGPCVFAASLGFNTNLIAAPRSHFPPPTNLPPELRRALVYFLVAQQSAVWISPKTNLVFSHFLPSSLNHLIWTNVTAHTNHKSMTIWSTRARPAGWPEKPTEAVWNPDSLLWGMKGFTALSPSWEGEVNLGQVPVTALTPRHGYTRGHHMGAAGFDTRFAGKRVWFLTKDNQTIERRVVREVVRTVETSKSDYTLLMFDQDLPSAIEPLRVTNPDEFALKSPARYLFIYGAPYVLFKTEQGGQVSAEIAGFTVNTWKGGDSGSPNLLPLPGELVFVSGRSTSGASAAMQADIDELCRLQRVNPRPYQLQWVDLSRFPVF